MERPSSQPPPSRNLPDLRQRAVDRLCEAFADDRIPVEEFERRVEVAHRATSVDELGALLRDLPDGDAVLVPTDAGADPEAGAPPSAARPPARSDRTWTLPPMARPHEVPEHAFVAGILGGGGKRGHWVPARRTWVVGILGGAELDFREAVFPPGVTEVRVLAVMGGVEAVVPPGIRVEASGIGIMGGFELKQTVPPTDHPDAPVLRFTGLGLMGGVEITVRYAGESGRDARRRMKEERRQKRLDTPKRKS